MLGIPAKDFNHPSSILIRHSNRPVAAIALCLCLGIALSLICREYSFGILAGADLCLLCASYWALRRDRLAASLTLGLSAVLIGGLLLALSHRDGFSNSDVRVLVSRGSFRINEPNSFEGCVIRESEERAGESVAIIEFNGLLRKDRWIRCKGKGILRISHQEDAEEPINLMRGDRVRGWAIWNRPHNFENPGSADKAGQLARRGIFLVGRVKSRRLLETLPGGCSDPWTRLAMSVRSRVRSSLEPIARKENGQPAAILSSLVIGDYSGLNNTTREIFQNSGAFHVLVVSGLHVAWITGLLLYLFKRICLPERIRYLAAALVILLYTCVVGSQASITRCLWMFVLYLIGRMFLRNADPVNILLGSALILLAARPDWLFEAGFQLSFLSVLAIAMTAVPLINAYVKPVCEPLLYAGKSDRLFLQPGPWPGRGRRLRMKWEMLVEELTESRPPFIGRILLLISRGAASAGFAIGAMMVTSLSVQLWLEPLLAHYFNRMSWISPVANLIIVPFSSVVLASGILATLASNLAFCGQALTELAGWLSSRLLSVVFHITMIPGAWQRCPTPSIASVLSAVLILLIWSFFKWRRLWIPCIYIVVLLACLSYGSVPVLGGFLADFRAATRNLEGRIWQGDASVLSFTFLDVGEGDSAVIRFPNKQIWVFDAGGIRFFPSHEDTVAPFDIGEAVVSRYLWDSWIIKLDRLILSHTDLDHAGGMPAVMKNFRIGRFDYSQAGADAILNEILGVSRQRQINAHVVHAGMEEKVGEVTVQTLNPPADFRMASANENSIVLKFSLKHFAALLTGDLEKAGETQVVSHAGSLRSQLLKVAHHGSRWGTSNALLDRAQPRWAVISVGRNNPFGHPSPEVFMRLLRHGTRPFLTLDEGAVTFETDGVHYAIKSHVRGMVEFGDL